MKILFVDSGQPPEGLEDKIERLFGATKKNGTGLGLGVLKILMQKQNGNFYLDRSMSNTCFVIHLPHDR